MSKLLKTKMKSYRITCLKTIKCDYLGISTPDRANGYSFRQVHLQWYPLVLAIKNEARKLGIKYIWHFYEPYIEITWMGDRESANKLFSRAEKICKNLGIKDFKKEIGEKDYGGPDWFCKGDPECTFGAKAHSACSDLIEAFEENSDFIEKSGYGIEAQVQRTIHRLCNPFGINYWDESKICFRQAVICALWTLNFKYPKIITQNVVRFIYNKVLRLKGRK